MSLSAGERLGPYEILAPLGAGGMGEVYRARDRKLDRDVAIKVLPPSVAGEPDSLARFEREAKAVAAISHPNILAIHDFGSHEGLAYAVMELLEGETLRGKLAAGPIPETRAMDYAAQIARGLSAAHDKGIVHRDLKPENIFVTGDGHVKILDFGLAKRAGPAPPQDKTSATTQQQQTLPGTVLGTVGYMSPEQVRGLDVDHRSDVFSFGAVLYEMLSGRRAFRGQTPADTMSAILREEPPRLAESGSRVSPALDKIVRHCLEKDPANRYQSARDIAFALSGPPEAAAAPARPFAQAKAVRRVVIASAVVLVLGVAAALFIRRPQGASAGASRVRRIAVLPFENLGSPEDDYFADGIADAVRGKLTSLPGVEVIARSSSIGYKKTSKTPRQIAGELDTGYLLTATVRWQKSGGASRVQVSPELVEVKPSGAPASKWQQPFDAALTDVFQVQSEIAAQVAQALGVVLGAVEEKRLAARPTQNLAAYDAFLKGQAVCKSLACDDPNVTRKALSFYEQAVALDPSFAQAWARVALSEINLYYTSTPTPEVGDRARHAAEKSVELAPDRPEGYVALGSYYDGVLNDVVGAQKHYARALNLGPETVELLATRATLERDLGHFDVSERLFRQAERLDPRSLGPKVMLGVVDIYLRRYPEARRAIDGGLALAPANLTLLVLKVQTFLGEGDLAGARAVLDAAPKEVEPTALVAILAMAGDLGWVLDERRREILLRLSPNAFDNDRAIWAICLAQASALAGDAAGARQYAEEARKAFEEQLRGSPRNPMLHANLGLALAYLGQRDAAIGEGERGVELRPVARDAFAGPYYRHLLARIYVLVGEPEKALDIIEQLMKIPYDLLSPGILKIDPNLEPLRKNPRFQKLVGEKM